MKIDKEFKELIPALSVEELNGLEESILKEGCRESIISWNGFIVDGHNRFEICSKHGIKFNVTQMRFEDRQEVIEWMIKNQFSRRNITSFVRTELALRLEAVISERAKRNQQGGQGGILLSTILPEAKPIDTRAELAKIANISEGTIQKVKVIQREGTEEQKEALRKGDAFINTVYKELRPPKEKREPVEYVPPKRISDAEIDRVYAEMKKPSEEGSSKNTEKIKPTTPIIQEMMEMLNDFFIKSNRYSLMPDLKRLENKKEALELVNKVYENIKKIKKHMEE